MGMHGEWEHTGNGVTEGVGSGREQGRVPKRCCVPAARRGPECWPSVTTGPSCPPAATCTQGSRCIPTSPPWQLGSVPFRAPPPRTVALFGRVPEAVASLQAPSPLLHVPSPPPNPPRVPHPSGGSESLSNPHPAAACGAACGAALPAAGTRVRARACSPLPSCVLHPGGVAFSTGVVSILYLWVVASRTGFVSILHWRERLRFLPGMFSVCTNSSCILHW